ncbi:MAG: hypothetical protein K8H99_10515, partial [Nitrospirae bacterium]|nr:hypothetical protein [Fimbriimonadaceae bacterium]
STPRAKCRTARTTASRGSSFLFRSPASASSGRAFTDSTVLVHQQAQKVHFPASFAGVELHLHTQEERRVVDRHLIDPDVVEQAHQRATTIHKLAGVFTELAVQHSHGLRAL